MFVTFSKLTILRTPLLLIIWLSQSQLWGTKEEAGSPTRLQLLHIVLSDLETTKSFITMLNHYAQPSKSMGFETRIFKKIQAFTWLLDY